MSRPSVAEIRHWEAVVHDTTVVELARSRVRRAVPARRGGRRGGSHEKGTTSTGNLHAAEAAASMGQPSARPRAATSARRSPQSPCASHLVTAAGEGVGGVGRAVVGLLRQRDLPVRALVHHQDERADALGGSAWR
jgi:hypothetical protein